jgi:hypothetical protein
MPALQPLERFRASVDDPVIIGDRVVIPRNADATVQVVKVEQASASTTWNDLPEWISDPLTDWDATQ